MIKLLKKLQKTDIIMIFGVLLLITGQVWLDLKLPDYMSEITKLIQTNGSIIGDVWIAGAKMLSCAICSALLSVATGFLVTRIASNLSYNIRNNVFDKIQSFSASEMNNFSTSSLITRTTNDIGQIQMFVALGLQTLIKSPILAIWAICKISSKSWQWSLVTAIAVLVVLATILTLFLICIPKFKQIQQQTDDLNRVTRENLVGLRVVRAHNGESYQENKFDIANSKLTKTNLFTSRTMSIMGPIMSLVLSGLTLAIYWIGCYIINSTAAIDKLNVFSNMIVFTSYAMQVIMAFMMLVMIFLLLPRATVSAKRINEVLSTKPTIIDGDGNTISKVVGEVEFKNVCFKYPGAEEYVLENINFKINQGETIAFIGSTGSGKSTLINLVPRIYDSTNGEVLIDGINVKDYKLSDLHNKIGYISQKAMLFNGSVKENIAFGECDNKITDEDINNALNIAQATEFVDSLPDKKESIISQGGTNVSGGQKQRLSIARALAKKPEIIIFDDSFSALDYRTDKKLRDALSKNLAHTTCLIVAQRIGTIKDANKIMVLDKGKIVGLGTHKELMKSCQVYQEIAYSQLSKEELKNE